MVCTYVCVHFQFGNIHRNATSLAHFCEKLVSHIGVLVPDKNPRKTSLPYLSLLSFCHI